MRELTPELILGDHPDHVGQPPDDLLVQKISLKSGIRRFATNLVTCLFAEFIMFVCRPSGVCIHVLDGHVTALIAWLPDGSGFISGGLDRKIILWVCEVSS
jgi:hypothetical protein